MPNFSLGGALPHCVAKLPLGELNDSPPYPWSAGRAHRLPMFPIDVSFFSLRPPPPSNIDDGSTPMSNTTVEFHRLKLTDLAEEIVHKNADISSQLWVYVNKQLCHVLQTFAHPLVAKVVWKIVRPLSTQVQH